METKPTSEESKQQSRQMWRSLAGLAAGMIMLVGLAILMVYLGSLITN
jgi:hypothetical protein